MPAAGVYKDCRWLGSRVWLGFELGLDSFPPQFGADLWVDGTPTAR